MKPKIIFTSALLCFLIIDLYAQSSAFITTIDPHEPGDYTFDKGTNIWGMEDFVYVVNGYIGPNQVDRIQQIFKIDANTRQIVKQVGLPGPQGDLAIGERGGYYLTADGHILLTGEWRDYTNSRMQAFIAKLDPDLELVWINYYPQLSNRSIYSDAVTETQEGDLLIYYTEALATLPNNPWVGTQSDLRVLKTTAEGDSILMKIIPDTFFLTVGYGSLTPTSDGNFFLSSEVVGYYYHPLLGTYRYDAILHKFDSDVNLIWSRMVNYCKFLGQEPVSTSLLDGGTAVMWRKDTLTSDSTVNVEFSVLHKLNDAGQTLWTREWHDYAVRHVYNITTAENGDILGVGFYSKGSGKGKGWLFRVSPDGDLKWERYYSDSLQRPLAPQFELLDICELPDGRVAATGIVMDTFADFGPINRNVVVLVLDSLGCFEPGCTGLTQYTTGISDPLFKLPDLKVLSISPNPAGDYCNIQLPPTLQTSKQESLLQCYDSGGALIESVPIQTAESSIPINTKSWPNGTYYLMLFNGHRPYASTKLIIQK